MRFGLLTAALLPSAVVAMPALAAQEFPVGAAVVKEGMEIVPDYLTGVEMDRIPSGMGMSKDSIHLQAEIHATDAESHGFAQGAWIPYLDIHYEMTREGQPTYKKTGILFPMSAKDGPHYANTVDMAGPGTYHLTCFISPPPSHGFIRHTDKASGVPAWWKPINLSWTFSYPGKSQ